ncbi:Alcohol dehydrogenase GroES domain protein [Beutenbergia cavernae DSM 12333]|uniref:Alcohol dehydrogenase GroES domain protein n=1 Tax=Beutenbergia cavernae (strain ATCC BAA-8 / DSM 12333 / CCUG 43141 / JCM 11478 / NBRC 16432 / NCIMB 13614 / HKI 0122) TaxID=471853 RepID=C5BVM2_BEUC1|nr:alcohol dehydrogenase catalytic domain-containing protein [Beutenbergia cavernae]ACQ78462.1 Alcohol dehydrogenase GroES domain protein [Beutenbergia cavernae DSM 12333]
MKALVLTGPHAWAVEDVREPVAGPGQVVVDVARVGVCGTDLELFSGDMAYLRDGQAAYPLRPGHEWCGTVSEVGDGVDGGLEGRRVTGDTMLGCGTCARCRAGRHHVCANRYEIGIRGGWHGALAERLLVPANALHRLPDAVDDVVGALVEPGGNALRAVRAAATGPGEPLLVVGPGTIGLLAALFARDAGADVHLLGVDDRSLAFARSLGFAQAWTTASLPELPWAAVIDASTGHDVPRRAVELVEPAGRVVLIGISDAPSTLDTRELPLRDLTVVGILGGSAGLAGAIERYASGAVDPGPLVAATVGLGEAGDVLGGWRPDDAGPGPKLHVDPRR